MSLIGNIDNIPVFTSIAEAELWGSQYNITGHHTHTILGVTGYIDKKNLFKASNKFLLYSIM